MIKSKHTIWRLGLALVLVLSLGLVFATPAAAADPAATLTDAGTTDVTGLVGDPATSGTEAGVHTIVVTDATACVLTGAVCEGGGDGNLADALDGDETLTLTIGGTEITTGAIAAATTLADAATNIQTAINAATVDPDIDVTVAAVNPTDAVNDGYLTVTVNLAGAANSITGSVTGSNDGETESGLGTGTLVPGTNATAIDTFTPAAGSNGLWQAAAAYGNGTTTMTIAHAPAAGTASSLTGLNTSVTQANAFINGITIQTGGGGVLAGTAVITVAPGAAEAYTFTIAAGNKVVDVAFAVTLDAVDSAGNRDVTYAGTAALTANGGATPDPATATFVAGTWADDITLDAAGNITITATDDTTPAITGDSAAQTVVAAPTISTATIFNIGAEDPEIVVTLVNDTFTAAGNSEDAANWTFAAGDTDLAIDTITRDSDTQVTIAFTGTAAAGQFTLQAKAAALTLGNPSNVMAYDVEAPADLTALTENLAGEFDPDFAAGTYTYALAAAHDISSVALTATLDGATITYGWGALTEVVASGVGKIFNLAVGANVITIEVVKAGFTTTNYTITVTRAAAPAAPPPGATGGPVVVPADSTTVETTGFAGAAPAVDANGSVTVAGSVTTTGGEATLTIPEGTSMTVGGAAVSSLTAAPVASPPAAPASATVVAAVDFGPDGATFSPAITLTFAFNPLDLPEGSTVNTVSVAWYDTAAGSWVELPGTVNLNNNTITVQVDHFTTFGIIAKPAPVPTAAPTQSTTTTAQPTQPAQTTTSAVQTIQPGPTEITSTVGVIGGTTTDDESSFPVWAIIVIGIVVAAAMVFVVRYGWNMRHD